MTAIQRPRAREAGFLLPGLPPGPLNAITDIAGVSVGHLTLHDDHHQPPIHTGVTVVIPQPGDLFNQKLVAAAHTINGYGKAAGFEQVRGMGWSPGCWLATPRSGPVVRPSTRWSLNATTRA